MLETMAMPKLRPEEKQSAAFLEALGLQVKPVPTSSGKTPEFVVDGDSRGYVVEVKARRDSKEWEAALQSGRVAYKERPTGYDRWAEDVAQNAVKQMRSSDPAHARWWVLWFAIECRATPEAMFEQAIGSLFGVRQVAYCQEGSETTLMRDCINVTRGVFERHPEIVAVVTAVPQGFSFCVNELAPDCAAFQESRLYRNFADIHPPTSASDLVNYRGFLEIADFSVDRHSEAAIAAYLEERYGLERALILNMKAHSASATVRRRPLTAHRD